MTSLLKLALGITLLVLLTTTGFAAERLRLATTTSTENSGLLAELLPPFEAANDCRVDVIAVGTGKAIKLGETGDVDVILVHARSKEDAFVDAGYGVDRRDVMYNDFVILGPETDPAGIMAGRDAAAAMAKIAASNSTFVSGADDSETYTREKQLWELLGMDPVHIDAIARQLESSVSQTAELLLRLEIRGLVKQLPGTFFTRDFHS
mgnify:CR=1 FL=1